MTMQAAANTILEGSNPIKEDPELRRLLAQLLGEIKTAKEFNFWKASFLTRFDEFLDACGSKAAEAAYASFDEDIGKLSKAVHQIDGYIRQGDLKTVKARRCLNELKKHASIASDKLAVLLPGSGVAEKTREAGYTNYHMGAVLIAHGFGMYGILHTCDQILMKYKDNQLSSVEDKQILGELDNYHKKFNVFCDVMADLGLQDAMKKTREILERPVEEEEDTEPESEDSDHKPKRVSHIAKPTEDKMIPRNSMRSSVHSRASLRGSVHSKKDELSDSLHSTSTIATETDIITTTTETITVTARTETNTVTSVTQTKRVKKENSLIDLLEWVDISKIPPSNPVVGMSEKVTRNSEKDEITTEVTLTLKDGDKVTQSHTIKDPKLNNSNHQNEIGLGGGSSHSTKSEKSQSKQRASVAPPQKAPTPAQKRIVRSSMPASKFPSVMERSPRTPGRLSESLHTKPGQQVASPRSPVDGSLSKSDHAKPKPRPSMTGSGHGGIRSLADALQDTKSPKLGSTDSPPDDLDDDDDSFAGGDEEAKDDTPPTPSTGKGKGPMGKLLKYVPKKDRKKGNDNDDAVTSLDDAAPAPSVGKGLPDDVPSPAAGKAKPFGKTCGGDKRAAPPTSDGNGKGSAGPYVLTITLNDSPDGPKPRMVVIGHGDGNGEVSLGDSLETNLILKHVMMAMKNPDDYDLSYFMNSGK